MKIWSKIGDLKFISDPLPPPKKLKVKLQGEAKKHQGSISGIYTVQPELVNNYPTWKQISSRTSIWINILTGRWNIGKTSDLGSITAGLIGPKAEDNWPQNLSGWEYGDVTNTWYDAGSDIVIEDYSKGNYENNTYQLRTILKFIQY